MVHVCASATVAHIQTSLQQQTMPTCVPGLWDERRTCSTSTASLSQVPLHRILEIRAVRSGCTRGRFSKRVQCAGDGTSQKWGCFF